MMPETFMTKLINRRAEPLVVYETDGPMLTLLPKDGTTIETRSSLDVYAKWDTVTWEADGNVILEERPGWKEPSRGRWEISILNADGKPAEQLMVNSKRIFLPKGIPVAIGVEAHHPLAPFSKITILAVPVKARSEEWPGYLVTHRDVRWVGVEREPWELEQIQGLIDDGLKTSDSVAKEATG
jgi:hypothetical protein